MNEKPTSGEPLEVRWALDDQGIATLVVVLEQAKSLGFLGPGPVREQILRSLAFAHVVNVAPPLAADLGTGGGLPGLVLACAWPTTKWALVDSNERRARWLSSAVETLGLAGRCEVICLRAEVVGRGSRRHGFDLVTARSFGPSGPTSECAAPLLRVGGQLVVSDPPEMASERWPVSGLALLGLKWKRSLTVTTAAGPVSLSLLTSVSRCSELYPRRVGVPFKRPLF
jgi:16S rRNA (guanine527-N7)-methyltransferase